MIDRQTDIQTACLVLPSLNSPKQPCQVFRDVWNILPVNFLLKLCELGRAIQSAQKTEIEIKNRPNRNCYQSWLPYRAGFSDSSFTLLIRENVPFTLIE